MFLGVIRSLEYKLMYLEKRFLVNIIIFLGILKIEIIIGSYA